MTGVGVESPCGAEDGGRSGREGGLPGRQRRRGEVDEEEQVVLCEEEQVVLCEETKSAEKGERQGLEVVAKEEEEEVKGEEKEKEEEVKGEEKEKEEEVKEVEFEGMPSGERELAAEVMWCFECVGVDVWMCECVNVVFQVCGCGCVDVTGKCNVSPPANVMSAHLISGCRENASSDCGPPGNAYDLTSSRSRQVVVVEFAFREAPVGG